VWEGLTQLEPLKLGRALDDPPYFDRVVANKVVTDLVFGTWVTCLAATDEIVVNGFNSGAIRILRVNNELGSGCCSSLGSPRGLVGDPQEQNPWKTLCWHIPPMSLCPFSRASVL
jgi:hypothetical protein